MSRMDPWLNPERRTFGGRPTLEIRCRSCISGKMP
jgi:hypothetical protein